MSTFPIVYRTVLYGTEGNKRPGSRETLCTLVCYCVQVFVHSLGCVLRVVRYKKQPKRSIEGDKIQIWVISFVIFSRRACIVVALDHEVVGMRVGAWGWVVSREEAMCAGSVMTNFISRPS